MSIDYINVNPVIAMRDIVKTFPGIRALDGVSLDVYPGEVLGVVGENGAGKSTLMKVLSGAYAPSSGSITVAGNSYQTLSPSLSRELGIHIVYQENVLAPGMNVIENVYIGEEKTLFPGIVDKKAMRQAVLERMKDLDIELDIDRTIENLSVADQQFVKILKALSVDPRVLILDEPTSMFNVKDAHKVLELVGRISRRGIGIIYISHFLTEVVEITDRITVIRDGLVIRTYDNSGRNTSLDSITRDMVGRPVELFYDKETNPIGEIIMEARDFKVTKKSPKINFSLRRGEILGFSGMVGSGRTELMRAITGADPRESGDVFIHGKKARIKNPADSIREGIAFITEDRQRLGLMLHASVTENTTLVGLGSKIKGFFINPKRHGKLIRRLIDSLQVKTPSLQTEVINLSGGNQQKVVLAKWLYAEQKIYIFDEPTVGIDANAKTEFYKIMSRLTGEGKAILLISSDMPELISMSDRVLVMRSGAVTDELTGTDINEHEIVKKALGVTHA